MKQGNMIQIRKRFFLRCTALLLVLCMVMPIFPTLTVQGEAGVAPTASTFVSFEGIEEIKANATAENPFTIVEIIPVDGQGNIGYYIPGEEPTAQWAEALSKLVCDNTATSNPRADYIEDLKIKLAGIIGADNTEPLKTGENYVEYLPWDSIPSATTKIGLVDNSGNPRQETKIVKGTFVEETAENPGEFRQNAADYSLVTGGETGKYIQNIVYFTNSEQMEGEYYYNPTFAEIVLTTTDSTTGEEQLRPEADIIASYKGQALYMRSGDAEPYSYTYYETVPQEVTDEAFVLDINTDYYMVTGTGAPSDNYDATSSPYMAIVNAEKPFVEPSEGDAYFIAKGEYWEYVGVETGTLNFVPNDSGTEIELRYSEIYVTAPYTNNNWFREFVFDDGDVATTPVNFPIEVISVTPEQLNTNATILDSADFIVLASGYNLDNSKGAYGISRHTEYNGNDLTAELVEKIKSLTKLDENNKTPVPILVDSKLARNNIRTSNTGKLARTFLSADFDIDTDFDFKVEDVYGGRVSDNKFVYSNNTSFTSEQFNVVLPDELYEDEDDPYYPVYSEIVAENFYRRQDNVTQLDEHISVATSIRYILNHSKRRIEKNKDTIKVLEIQPAAIADSVSEDSERLTEKKVKEQILGDVNVKVVITPMSIQEFIGKIEDINENYDMVYIGASANTLHLEGGKPNYNDDNMDGMYYTNIGDIYENSKRIGLLNSDYKEPTQLTKQEWVTVYDGDKDLVTKSGKYNEDEDNEWGYWQRTGNWKNPKYVWTAIYKGDEKLKKENGEWGYYETTTTELGWRLVDSKTSAARLSGNDLTPKKRDELNYFANSGFPIVISNKLIEGNGAKVDENAIDCNSILFACLNEILPKDNVIRYSEVYADNPKKNKQFEIRRYANLSKPTIEFVENVALAGTSAGKPIPYTTIKGADLGTYPLQYAFKIKNETDTTPLQTRYTASLFIDQNADGRHADSEKLSGLTVYEVEIDASGNITSKVRVAEDAMKSDVYYLVERALPSVYEGAFPWSLEIKINGEESHTSAKGYSFKKPAKAIDISILQIYPGGNGKENETGKPLDEVDAYSNLFDELSEAGLYNVTIEPITIPEINAKSPEELAQLFNEHDMLILGFGEAYGYDVSNELEKKGLNYNVANAVVDFIDKGRAVLFTHDTSTYHIVSPDIAKDNGVASGMYTGYYFNMVMRDSLGLDRYGVTSPEYGLHKQFAKAEEIRKNAAENANVEIGTYKNYVANNYSDIDDTTKAKILNDDYSIAYEPGKKGEYAETTQGFTSFATIRGYNKDKDEQWPTTGSISTGNNSTSTVSQVNEGQITNYPYSIEKTLAIPSTHEQWYQLNMNSDEVVVWYCLGGNNYKDFKNDVTNAYYIYNKGNVTYSGAGHSGNPDSPAGKSEAKLFVNTMIAAYRAGTVPPEIEFADKNNNEITAHFLPSIIADDKIQILSAENDEFTDRKLGFKIEDQNIGEITRQVSLYYEVAGTGDYNYNASKGEFVSASGGKYKKINYFPSGDDATATTETQLSSSFVAGEKLYTFDITDEMLASLGANNGAIEMYLEVRGIDKNDVEKSKNLISLSKPLSLRALELLKFD